MRRILGPLLLILLVGGVAFGIYLSSTERRDEKMAKERLAQMEEIKGLIGSEKEGFFADPQVVAVLEQKGISLRLTKAGSRQMATSFDTQHYDFAFPAGLPAGEKIRQTHGIKKSFDIFFTPMAIASWEPIVRALESNGIVTRVNQLHCFVRMKPLLELMAQGKRWKDLEGNREYAISKSILISSTDVRKSNSAAMYLGLMSYVANGDEIVTSDEQISRIMPMMEALFLRQGFQESSSAGPFEDYTMMGMGKAPLVMIYESQFIEYAAHQKGNLPADMVLLYPVPTLFTKHSFIPLTPRADRLGELLQNDPMLQRLAIEHGFRNGNDTYFREFTRSRSIQLPETVTDVVDPPSFEILERMIGQIEAKYQ